MSISRIILTTGGTGGHIFPAIAVAEEIRRRNPQAMILFIGSKYGIEADIAVNAGLDYAGLPVKGVMGKGFKGIAGIFSLLRSISKAIRIIRKTQPEVVIGFGGYAAFAATMAGKLCKKKTAIHEQNSFPGMSNRMLGKRVDKVFLSMPDSGSFFQQEKIMLTGNPIRSDIVELANSFEQRISAKRDGFAQEKSHRLLVLGGSLGATALNQGMMKCIHTLVEKGVDVWHQTGKSDSEVVRNAYREVHDANVRVEPFITDMKAAYEWADVVLCRAGASTLAEITAVGLPSILVPFPYAAQDHQRYNARYLQQEGAALVMEQSEFLEQKNASSLSDGILALFANTERIFAMSEASKKLGQPDAAKIIVDELEKFLPR